VFATLIFPPFINEQVTPDQAVTGSAGGIPIAEATPLNATFVGAV
jgi:hypothetical protein